MTEKQVIVDGLHTSYTDDGTGDVVLILHGWGSNKENFASLSKALVTAGYRCITLDLPGFGKTANPLTSWAVSDYASFVSSLLKKLNIKSVTGLIGHSLGGRISIKLVSHRFIETSSLILIASAGVAKRKTLGGLLIFISAKILKVVLLLIPIRSLQNKIRRKLYSTLGSTDYLDSGSMKGTFVKIIEENLESDARNIPVPTILIWGENDETTPVSEGETLQSCISNSSLTVLENAGHYVHNDQPEVTFDVILKFLQR